MTPNFPNSGPLVIMTVRPTCTNVLKAIVGYEQQGGDVNQNLAEQSRILK
jgi:hypothetical protein